jgi:hypothetical protein
VICKALAKSPDERYQTCRELADDLKNFKYLAGPASPAATTMVKVPPLPSTDLERAAARPVEISRPPAAPAEAALTTPIEQSSPRRVPAQVMPPPTTYQKPHTSPAVWILMTLGAVVLLGILGGVGVYVYKKSLVSAKLPVGQLQVESNIPGATISVDGQIEPNCVTPCTISDLSVGSHQVVISKEGYDNYPQAVTIEDGKTNSLTASLAPQQPETPPQTPAEEPAVAKTKLSTQVRETTVGIPPLGGGGRPGAAPKTGQLQVTANVSGAKISVDGSSEPNWVTPYSSTIVIAAGTHQVVVSKEGYDDYQQSVTIEGGKPCRVNARLSVGSGEVEVATKPPGFEVLIDGRSIGPSPAHASVSAGKHAYTILRPGAAPYENTVSVESGKVKLVTVTMSGGPAGPATEIVTVNTIPPGATVSADGNPPLGQTPTSFPLTAGQHKLVISYSGRSVERVIEVRIGEPVEVRVDMRHQ